MSPQEYEALENELAKVLRERGAGRDPNGADLVTALTHLEKRREQVTQELASCRTQYEHALQRLRQETGMNNVRGLALASLGWRRDPIAEQERAVHFLDGLLEKGRAALPSQGE